MNIPALRVIYADGTSDTVVMTQLDIVHAEEHAVREGWNLGGERHRLYGIYWHLRHTGDTRLDFDAWCENVVHAMETTVTIGENPTHGRKAAPAN